MRIKVVHDYFQTEKDAGADVDARGLHAVSMQVPPVHNESHWHMFSTRIYILDGQLNITDTLQEKTFTAGPGALVEVPERVLHSEHSDSGYTIIAGMTIPATDISEPVDLPPSQL